MGRDVLHVHVKLVMVVAFLLTAGSLSAEEQAKRTSTFPQNWLKTLVSIEVWEPNEPKGPEKGPEPKPIASGFLVRTPGNHMALVTAGHVVFDKKGKLRANLAYRLNRKDGLSDLFTEEEIAGRERGGWLKAKKHDVACRLMVERKDGSSDILRIDPNMFLTKTPIEPGAPLFVIGFPMGLRSEEHATPILRRGMVARTDADIIIADAFVFSGNSGGPVIYTPTLSFGRIFRTALLQGQWLVGLVSETISYREEAVSPQTGRTRVVFEDNAGLCKVVPASAILELLESPEFKAVDVKMKSDP